MECAGGMRAVVRDERGVTMSCAAVPEPATGEVVIDVAYAGVCRSDLAVVAGTVAVANGRVLGHELAGRVRTLGAGVTGLAAGDRVTVIPFEPCGSCAACVARPAARCVRLRWIGFDADGGFADQIRIPARDVVPLAPGMSLLHGAYVEPVAAALGALAYVERGARTVVCGDGRIAELSARVLEAHGAAVTRAGSGPPPPGGFDVAIEHGGATSALLAALRPGGTLILKSRARMPVAFDAGEIVARDLVIRGASHGSFATAVDWLAERRIAIDDLLAPARPLEAFADVFAAARAGEQRKQMFAIAPARERA